MFIEFRTHIIPHKSGNTINYKNFSSKSKESVSIKFEGSRKEMVNYELEVFLKPTYPPVTVQPFLKTSTNSDEVSSVTIYASVMKQDKPILRAKVWATICFPEGSCIEEPLQDSVDSEGEYKWVGVI